MPQKPMNQKLFNLDLLILDDQMAKQMKEVKSLAIFQSSKKEFDPEGLFSVQIFGPIGHEQRSQMPAYIDLKIPILHPLVFRTLISLKAAYLDILEGKTLVKFDSNLGDFVTDPKGETGYTYFMKYLEKIKWENASDSTQREFRIELIKKYGNKASMFSKWLVIPAGLRDYTIDDKGQPSEDGINNLYRKLLATAQMLKNTRLVDDGSNILDNIKLKIQKITVEIYEYIEKLMDGKGKFIQHRWANRSIAYGTRNVITSVPSPVTDLSDPNRPTANHTIIGIGQYIKGIGPIAMNKIHTKFINKIMTADIDQAYLIDPKTLQTKLVRVSPKERESWLSLEGLSDTLDKLLYDEIITSEIHIADCYPCMIADKGDEIFVIFDTGNLPEGITLKDLRPITYMEMAYIAVCDTLNKYIGLLTRYPVLGLGSIYPTRLYVRTTINGRKVKIHINNETYVVNEYPVLGLKAHRAFSAHYSHLGRLDADHDGDTVSLNILYTEESLNELNKMLNDKKFYITTEGKITYSAGTTVTNLVLKHLTTPPLDPDVKTDFSKVKLD